MTKKNKDLICTLADQLPVEEILSRLPVKSLLRFKCVCKAWRILIEDPTFIALHVNQFEKNDCGFLLYNDDLYTNNPEYVKWSLRGKKISGETLYMQNREAITVGSCDGLICQFRLVSCDPFMVQFEEEVVQETKVPINYEYDRHRVAVIREYEDSVSLISVEEGKFDVWVMKEFGVAESWVKQFTIQHSVLNFVPKLEYSVLKEQISDEKERKQDFIRTSEAMLSILEKPPRGFGDFVAGYFRKWSHRILLSYKEEMEKHDESTNDLKLFVRLLKAFEFNGSYCGHHYDDKVRSMLKDDDQRDRKDDFSLEKPIDLFKLVWQ
ncbi:hypothetical protein COLO4_16840 [Corchorus olitorius]|uniref:F-box domain-containing protein n=1 Tax=Corchorus olitorius TaxID=93759 RepID=A0A1R3JFG4_9ROSI|nr:hypothetical protein COLO4_16840 [Corchorus olitorius]